MEFGFASEMLIQRVGMTLLYSLGLGLALALLAGFVLLFTQNKSAAIRYNLLITLLGLFLVSVAIVFYQLAPLETAASHSFGKTSPALREGVGDDVVVIHVGQHPLSAITDFFLQYLQIITMVWLLAVVFKTIRMAQGIYDLNYIKRNKIYPVGLHWEEVAVALAAKIGVTRPVRLVQSGLVRIPIVVGHLKPIIFIPLGVITNIPAGEIEMMLLHELAHIKRSDFFINLLQQCAELLFFFNPAVLWLSYLIRTERENCCDDIALAHAGNRSGYIRALVSFSTYQDNEPVYAMAFAREANLLDRVKRIAFGKNRAMKFPEKVFLVIAMVLLCSFTVLFSRGSAEQDREGKIDEMVFEYPYKQPESNGGKKAVEPNSLVANRLLRASWDVSTKDKTIKTERLPQLQSGHLISSDTMPEYREEKILYPIQPLNLGFSKSLLSLQNMLSARRLDSLRMEDSLTRFHNGALYGNNYGSYFKTKPGEFKKDLSLNAIVQEHHERFYEQVLDEIQKAGVKLDRLRSNFYLSNDELIVDGVKQPADVHIKIISKFLRHPEDKLDFILDVQVR